MGREITGNNDKDSRVVIEPVKDEGNGGSTGSTSSTTTSTTANSGGSGGNGSGGTGGSGNTETVKGSTVPELAILTDEEKAQYLVADETEQKRIMRNAKRRQRYANQKAENGQPVKPRKVKGSNKKEETPALDVTQLNMILASLSAVVASRPNCEHWLLSEQEINSITVPLSKMLAESTMFANMGQYSNQIALTMACITVFMPRLIVTIKKNQEVKKIARTGQSTNTAVSDERIGTTGKEKKGNSGIDRGDVKKPSSNGSNNVDNVPFYGVPIC